MESSPGWRLRALALQIEPPQLWMSRSAYAPVFGFVLDELIATGGWWALATFADGSTSLYTSGPGSVIGAGSHAVVQAESSALLLLVRHHLAEFAASPATDLPASGEVALRALTTSGQRVITAPEQHLAAGGHPASELYRAAHALVAAVRTIAPA